MSSLDKIVVGHNHWRIPDPKTALSGVLEGCPSEQRRQEMIAEATAARKNWKPNAAALKLVKRLESFVGCQVRIQLWDPEMLWHELEGPFAFNAKCLGAEVRTVEGFQQAFLRLGDIVEIENQIGYSPDPYFEAIDGCDYVLASLADLYEISKVEQRRDIPE